MRRLNQISRSARFLKEFMQFKNLQAKSARPFAIDWAHRYPCLDDNQSTTSFDRHYIYHPAWAARILKNNGVKKHVDISSSLNFCTLISAFIDVDFYDYRPAELNLSGLKSKRADLLKLPFNDNEISSLSCMHVVEHVGLGRYGDTLDAEGDLKAAAELERVLAPQGDFLFVVPVGEPKIMFNAHRVYSYEQVVQLFSRLKLHQFTLIPDTAAQGGLIEDASPTLVKDQNYACGCFWFKK